MTRILHSIYLLFTITSVLLAQQKQTGWIRGIIRDAETNAVLQGVNVSIFGTTLGDAADAKGKYEVRLEPGLYTVLYEMIGFQTIQINDLEIKEGEEIIKNIYLIQKAMEYNETIKVIGERDMSKEPLGSAQNITPRIIEKRAGNFEDVTRVLQTFPGVVAQSDFSGKMYIRGGRVDENTILFDRIYIYEAYHLGGLVSIFNPDLTKNIEFYTGSRSKKWREISAL